MCCAGTCRTPSDDTGGARGQGPPASRACSFSYLLSANVHVPHGDPSIRGTGDQLPRELKVTQGLHPVAANDTQRSLVSMWKTRMLCAPRRGSLPVLEPAEPAGTNWGRTTASSVNVSQGSVTYSTAQSTVSTKETLLFTSVPQNCRPHPGRRPRLSGPITELHSSSGPQHSPTALQTCV